MGRIATFFEKELMIGIDLFSGAGGMSLGAKTAGIDVQQVVEADLHAASTYLANHKPKHGLFNDDIRKYKPKKIEGRDNEGVIVFGGPPCQGFSTSNQRTRTLSNENNWLFEEFIRVVTEIIPDWVVFENVKGILETEDGYFVEKITEKLELLGYTTTSKVLNSTEFGIPQRRSRFFIIARLGNKSFQFPLPTHKKPITVRQALADLPKLKNGASQCYLEYSRKATSKYAQYLRRAQSGCYNNLVTNNNDIVIRRYKHIPPGGNWESIPERLMGNYADKKRCHTGIYRRLKEDEPSVVIGNYRKNMLVHPNQDRGLSVREAARLQSFPDSFRFAGSIGFQQQQVGNAVPPLLAKTIFTSIVEQR